MEGRKVGELVGERDGALEGTARREKMVCSNKDHGNLRNR